MNKPKAVVSRSQAFTRFLPGAVETIDGETVLVRLHDVRAAGVEHLTRTFLQEQLRGTIARWEFRDAAFRPFLENAQSAAFEFVRSDKIVTQTLPVVECRKCRAVFNTRTVRSEEGKCQRSACNGRLRVLPFIEIHACGEETAVRVPLCPIHGDQFIVLERHAARRWACGVENCEWHAGAFAGFCGKGCYYTLLRVPLETKQKRKNQVLVGSGSVFRTQTVDIVNPPQGDLGRLFNLYSDFIPQLFFADYLGVYQIDFDDLEPLLQVLAEIRSDEKKDPSAGVRSVENVIENLPISDEQRRQLLEAMAHAPGPMQARSRVGAFQAAMSRAEELVPNLASATVPWQLQKQVHDLSLAVHLRGASNIERLIGVLGSRGGSAALSALQLTSVRSSLERFSLRDITVLSNFPIVSCAYGYTRGSAYGEISPVLRAFPKRPSVYGGNSDKVPFYTLSGTTEALIFELSPASVKRCLEQNGLIGDRGVRAGGEETFRAWLLGQCMVDDPAENPVFYSVYTLVHSYAHRLLEQLALESCFSVTSLSEIIMPAALGLILYVNQQSEFNIGGLASFIEQRLERALEAVIQPTPCMFDPICSLKDGGACNGCLYLPEVTCREFNAGLTRTALFGGALQPQHDLAKICGTTHFTGLFAGQGQDAVAS